MTKPTYQKGRDLAWRGQRRIQIGWKKTKNKEEEGFWAKFCAQRPYGFYLNLVFATDGHRKLKTRKKMWFIIVVV